MFVQKNRPLNVDEIDTCWKNVITSWRNTSELNLAREENFVRSKMKKYSEKVFSYSCLEMSVAGVVFKELLYFLIRAIKIELYTFVTTFPPVWHIVFLKKGFLNVPRLWTLTKLKKRIS